MEEILAILKEIRPDVDLSKKQLLIDDGILDSFDIVALVGELNDAFGVAIEVNDLEPANFNTPEAMLELVTRLADE